MKNKEQKLFRFREKDDYFNTISKVIIFMMMVSVIVGSVFMFAVSKYTVTQENEKRIEAMLRRIESNANQTEMLIDDFAENLQHNYQIYHLMQSSRITPEEYYRAVEILKSDTLYSYGFLKEIYLYNALNGQMYSTSGNITMAESGLNEILASNESIKEGIPLFRESKIGSTKGEIVSTFFFSMDKLGINDKNSFLAIDVSVDEFVGNLASELSNENCKMIIMDGDYKILWQSGHENVADETKELPKAVKTYYEKRRSSFSHEGEKYVVTAIPYEKFDWNIVYLNEDTGLYDSVHMMTALWIGVTALLVFLGLYISGKVSRYIYRPIQDTMVLLEKAAPEDGMKKQYREFQVILDSVRDSGQDKRKSAFARIKERKAESEKIIRRILEHSFELTDEKLECLNEHFQCDLKIESPSVMTIVSFLAGKEPQKEEKELLSFSIANIFMEKLGEVYKNYIYSIVNSSLVVIINDVDENEKQKLLDILQEAKQIYEDFMNQKLQITCCEDYETLLDTSTVYERCVYFEKYHRLHIGQGCITEQMLGVNENNKNVRYDAKLDESLKQAVFMENIMGLQSTVEAIFDGVRTLKYENAVLSLLHLSDYTQDVLNEKNQKKLDSDIYDFSALKKSILEVSSLDEFQEEYTRIVLEFMKKLIKKKESTQTDLLENVKQYIEENFDNSELCAQSIADKFKLSAKYLSYEFKEYTGMSLLVYLQKKRIDVACELLETTNMAVGEVSYKIGIENENYFYTLFKKNVGMTPKQYRQSKITL